MKYRLTFHFKSPHPYQTCTHTQTGAPFEVPSLLKKVMFIAGFSPPGPGVPYIVEMTKYLFI